MSDLTPPNSASGPVTDTTAILSRISLLERQIPATVTAVPTSAFGNVNSRAETDFTLTSADYLTFQDPKTASYKTWSFFNHAVFKKQSARWKWVTISDYTVTLRVLPAARGISFTFDYGWFASTDAMPKGKSDLQEMTRTAKFVDAYPLIPGAMPPPVTFVCPLGQEGINATIKAGTAPCAPPVLFIRWTSTDENGEVKSKGDKPPYEVVYSFNYQLGAPS